MISGLWNGVTGLNTFERALETQSNNVTNSNTIAHKSDEISFEDLMYQNRYGKGVTVQGVEKNFKQGGINITDNTLDVAIEGQGFFVVHDQVNDERFYTRAGNFRMGTDGTLETLDSHKVLGSATTFSNIVSSDDNQQFNSTYTEFIATAPINAATFTQTINAKATNYRQTAADSGTSGQDFLSSSSKISNIELLITNYNEKIDLYSANPVEPGTASTSQVSQISFADFDHQLYSGRYAEIYIDGNSIRQNFDTDPQTTMNLFADKISSVAGIDASVDTNGLLTISSIVPGEDNRITGASINDRGYGIDEVTSPEIGSGYAMVSSARTALKDALENAGAKLLDMTNTIRQADSNLTGIGTMQLKLDALNISENVFGELSIEDGAIFAKDENNKFLIGRLETINFPNPESLEPQGSTLYSIGKETGDPQNADNINKIIGGAIELSNTSFSEDLIDLMLYQRAFEASSKSISTSDEFLRTAIELKK